MRRVQRRWSTRFGRWVGRVSVLGVQQRLAGAGVAVTRKAVYHWLAGARLPRLSEAVTLERVSRGAVRPADIVAHARTVCRKNPLDRGGGGA